MSYGISTKLVKLDLKTILENYKKPEFWKKDWVIFKKGDFKLVWHLDSINCRDNTISSVIVPEGFITRRGKRISISYWDYSFCRSIPISHDDYSQETFERNILGTALQVIKSVENSVIKRYREYEDAENFQDQENAKLTEIAEAFLNENNITIDKVRDAYIDKFVNDNKSEKFTTQILNEWAYKVLSNYYLLLISFFNAEKTYKEYKEKVGAGKRKKFCYDIWKAGRQLDTKEWTESMKENLEAI
jgi:hypothetical protein